MVGLFTALATFLILAAIASLPNLLDNNHDKDHDNE